MGFLKKLAAGALSDLVQDKIDGVTGAIDEKHRPDHTVRKDSDGVAQFVAADPGWDYDGFLRYAGDTWEQLYRYLLASRGDRKDHPVLQRLTAVRQREVQQAADRASDDRPPFGAGDLQIKDISIEGIGFTDTYSTSLDKPREHQVRTHGIRVEVMGSVPVAMPTDQRPDRAGTLVVDGLGFVWVDVPDRAPNEQFLLSGFTAIAEGGIQNTLKKLPGIGELFS